MTKWIAMLALSLAPMAASAALEYSGSLNNGNVGFGSLSSQSGWLESDGFNVDFWSFSGSAGETVSLFAWSEATDIAFSLYTGEPELDPFLNAFSNNSDWDEFPFGSGQYLFEFVALSSAPGDETLLDFILPSSGLFTLAIGGEVPGYLVEGEGPFAYSLQLVRQVAEVPLPGAGWLMLSGLAGLALVRRRVIPA